jgi:hypothetical protein
MSARVCRRTARAARKRASAWAIVVFAVASWPSSASSSGSPKIFHHVPRGRASPGWATFHSDESTGASLKEAGETAVGFS